MTKLMIRYYECDRDNEGEDEAPPPENATRKDIAWQLVSTFVKGLGELKVWYSRNLLLCLFK